jgi:hypothetical protein
LDIDKHDRTRLFGPAIRLIYDFVRHDHTVFASFAGAPLPPPQSDGAGCTGVAGSAACHLATCLSGAAKFRPWEIHREPTSSLKAGCVVGDMRFDGRIEPGKVVGS